MTRSLLATISVVVLLLAVPSYGAELVGFSELAHGVRIGDDKTKRDGYNLSEFRTQLEYSRVFDDTYSTELFTKAGFLADAYNDDASVYVRELNLFLSPLDNMDIKVGRQILTWGVADLIFITDVFPKDYESFFAGRELEYLKKPSDAIRVWLWLDAVNMDIILIPRFEPNTSLEPKRFSFYYPFTNTIEGVEGHRTLDVRSGSEKGIRLYRMLGGWEAALYLFKGFYKQPRGIKDESKRVFYYPELTMYGLTLRGQLAGGVAYLEAGLYDSEDDPVGKDPNVVNSMAKYLVGYTRGSDTKVGVQYLLEEILDYDNYRDYLKAGSPMLKELTHTITLSFTKLLLRQTLIIDTFLFYSPTNKEAYFRGSVEYKVSDALSVTAGTNLFDGSYDHTEFGQLKGNDNLYVRLRYSF